MAYRNEDQDSGSVPPADAVLFETWTKLKEAQARRQDLEARRAALPVEDVAEAERLLEERDRLRVELINPLRTLILTTTPATVAGAGIKARALLNEIRPDHWNGELEPVRAFLEQLAANEPPAFWRPKRP
jgi:hypothetical protein